MRDLEIDSGLKWVVEGVYNHSVGHYELVIDTKTNTVVHFLYWSTK